MLKQYRLWRYYFYDIPCWALGLRSKKRWHSLQKSLEQSQAELLNGLQKFKQFHPHINLKSALEKALFVRIIKNTDAYTCINLNKKKLDQYVKISGIKHLLDAQKQQRPIILLTGHIGSFYVIPAIFSQLDINMNLLARSVDHSKNNPCSQQYFERLNYYFTEKKMLGQYIYTNYTNKLDRKIITTCKENGILLALIDIPKSLFSGRHHPVKLLGKPASLPRGIIDLGKKYNALFLTVWNTIEMTENFSCIRHLNIEPIMPDNLDANTYLQLYADRLSLQVQQQPWQWMGISVFEHY